MSYALRIADELTLEASYVTKTAAILAKRRVGKTYTAAVVAEELVAAGIPWYALDPTGAWWGLRASANGKAAGLPVIVLGGPHGDIPINEHSGKEVADLIVDEPSFYVVDLVEIDENHSATVRFATAFLSRLYSRKARHPVPLHGFWDEGDMFAPQRPGHDETKMLGAAERIVRRGGLRGLGTTIISQRPAVVNKNVLTQIDIAFLLQIVGTQDRKAVEEYLKDAAPDEVRREVMGSLAGLGKDRPGECWVYAPGEDFFKRIHVRQRKTFNSSATPQHGEAIQPVRLADVDVDQLRARMAQTIERAKADDPKFLNARIRELEAELAKRPTEQVEVEVIREVEVPVLPPGNRLETVLMPVLRTLPGLLEDTNGELRQILERVGAPPETSAPRPSPPPPRPASPAKPAAAPTANGGGPALNAGARGSVTRAQQRVLDTLAWFESLGIAAPARAALAPMAGTRPTSGGFKNNLGALRTAGLIDYPTGGRVALTDDGRAAAVPPDLPATDEALQDAVKGAVTNAQASILDALIVAYPRALDRESLAELVGVTPTSGGFKNNLGALRTLELIDYPQPGAVVALPILFPTS